MPWTVGDVDRHKKGLSDAGKKRWVKVANAALSACIKKGGTDKTCAPKAIRIANSVAGNEQFTVRNNVGSDYTVEKRMHQGKEHWVVPTVMMVEGVHHGTHGPLFHSIKELGRFPEAWNGIPVVVNHPQLDGVAISANSPDVVDEEAVGRVYNAHVRDDTKLAAEVWLDPEKLRQVSLEVLEYIEKGQPLDVSLGMFSDEDVSSGEWNGEKYEAIAKNHRPDHLALLPGDVGACSWLDGCGIRLNKQVDNVKLKKEVDKMATDKDKPCPVKEKVDALIANSDGKYTEDDREALQALSEDLLDRMATPIVEEKIVEVEKIVEKEVEKEVQVNALNDEDKAALEYGKAQLKAKRDDMVKGILDNSADGLWTKEILESKDLEDLERIHGMIKKEEVVDYSLQGSVVPAGEEVPVLLPPIEVEPNKE